MSHHTDSDLHRSALLGSRPATGPDCATSVERRVVPISPQNPAHYRGGHIECIDAIFSALGTEGAIAYCRGNALKYAWRAGAPGREDRYADDIAKGEWHLRRAEELVKGLPRGVE